MGKLGEINPETGVPSNFLLDLFDKIMVVLDVKMAFAKLQSWDSSAVELWELFGGSFSYWKNGGWKEQCPWFFFSTSFGQRQKV